MVRLIEERKNTMSRIHLKSISSLIAAVALAASMPSQAQAKPQTIVVDGVTYQAVSNAQTLATPYIQPVVAPIQTTAFPAQTYSGYEAQSVHPSAQVVLPLVATAIGVWALRQWIRADRPQAGHQGYQGHNGHRQAHRTGHRPVHHTGNAPVISQPHHGGYHR